MRWKLLIAASLLAAAACACVYAGFVYLALAFWKENAPDWLTVLALLSMTGPVIFASIFVYRHTPRHRALQATLTAVLSTLLALATYLALYAFARLSD